MHPRASDKVLICCRLSNACLSFSLRSLLRDLLGWISLDSEDRPHAGTRPSGMRAFIVLMGFSEGHLTLFHSPTRTHPAPAWITPQAWPFHLHQRPRTTRRSADQKLPELPARWALHYPGRRQGLSPEHPEITLAGQIFLVTPTGAGWEEGAEERDLKDRHPVEILTKVTGGRGKGRSPPAESSVPSASLICAPPSWFLPFLPNTCTSIYLLFSLNQL